MYQNQAKSNYKDCSFGNRDSFAKGTCLSVLILAKSQAGRSFEVLELASLVSTYIFIEEVKLQVSKTASRSLKSTNQAHNSKHYHSVHVSKRFYVTFIRSKSRNYRIHKILCTQPKRPLIYSQHRSATQRMVILWENKEKNMHADIGVA